MENEISLGKRHGKILISFFNLPLQKIFYNSLNHMSIFEKHGKAN